MDIQKQGIIDQVNESQKSGRKVNEVLSVMGIKSSTFYRWKKQLNNKDENPQMRHRQIQGLLQNKSHYFSASSVYKVLKHHGLVEKYERRPAPWDEPFYEMHGANMMWGADWTKLRIGGERWYLLTLIDFFSRKIISWKILKTVVARDITELYLDGLSEFNGMPADWPHKPELRVDQGSPNTSYVTKQFFKDIVC